MGDIFESNEEIKLMNSACTAYAYSRYLLLWNCFCEFVFELLETVVLLMVLELNYSVNSVPGILLIWHKLALHEHEWIMTRDPSSGWIDTIYVLMILVVMTTET